MSTATLTNNATNVGAIYEAFGRGDIPFILQQVANECKWIAAGGEHLPSGGVYTSKEVGNFFTRLNDSVEFLSFNPIAIHNINDQEVIAFGNLEGKSRATGKTASTDWAMHWKFDDKGKIINYQDYYDTVASYIANQQ